MKHLAVVLVLTMTTPASARCFLFFCTPYHRVHHVSPQSPRPSDRFCNGVKDAYSKSPPQDSEKFVLAFPANRQDKVRRCISGG